MKLQWLPRAIPTLDARSAIQAHHARIGPARCAGEQRRGNASASPSRARFTQPRILIFDEATSAPDYESEAILPRNMAAICQGRTVIVIAHRLSSVRGANRIVVMDQGRIAEEGLHDALLQQPNGLCARLWSMQSGSATQLDAGAP